MVIALETNHKSLKGNVNANIQALNFTVIYGVIRHERLNFSRGNKKRRLIVSKAKTHIENTEYITH
jgi:hypothetical protein